MTELALHTFHEKRGAHFGMINGEEMVLQYSDLLGEYSALHDTVGVLDLSFRSRLCLLGADRVRFLHGQVTNDVKALAQGAGCYAALTTAKGKMQSDLNIYRLDDELLLDFEPGLSQTVSTRLEKYIVADDVQVLEVASLYGLLSVQGPRSGEVVAGLKLFEHLPEKPCAVIKAAGPEFGEVYLSNQSRVGTLGFDLFVPVAAQANVMEKLIGYAGSVSGGLCGWQALEMARIEAGIPRFGADMDEANFPQECGIENRAVSYTKGCYIGQEVLNRIHTLGHVNRELTGLRLANDLKTLPIKGDKLFDAAKGAGYITSALDSPRFKARLALGYVRKELNQTGRELRLRSSTGESTVQIQGSFSL